MEKFYGSDKDLQKTTQQSFELYHYFSIEDGESEKPIRVFDFVRLSDGEVSNGSSRREWRRLNDAI